MSERGMCHPDGRICVETFLPPHATAQFRAWSRNVGDAYGPLLNWVVEYGRNRDGIDYVAVWVPEEQIPAPVRVKPVAATRELPVPGPGRVVAA